jgi:phosphopantetheinyl transferase (holo-ACP synthase)
MIGNDVIDFNQALKESSWKRKNFLQKLFMPDEEKFILNSGNIPAMVWLLWSMKESSYKIYFREKKKYSFAPLKFNCTLLSVQNNIFSGECMVENYKFLTYSELSDELISTIAVTKEALLNNFFMYNCFRFKTKIYKDQQEEIYKHILHDITIHIKTLDELKVIKNEFGIPSFLYKGLIRKDLISISHHGQFAAYFLLIINQEVK